MNNLHENLLQKAVDAHTHGDEGQAERLYKDLLEETRDARALSYLAEIYMNREEYGEAEDLLDEAVELDSEDATIWLNIGNLHYLQENNSKALAAFERAAKLDAEDTISRYQIAVLKGNSGDANKYRKGYTESLFDDYAAHFDEALVNDLNYATPQNFATMMRENFSKQWFMEGMLDVGCGTGLVAEAFGDHVEDIVGVDLSEGMLDVAEEKNVYDELHQEDVVDYLKKCKEAFSLITAADVLVYLGDLKPFMHNAYKRLYEGGYLLISVEEGAMGMFEGYKVQTSGRFCHKPSYVRKLAAKCGFEEVDYQHLRLRDESGAPLMGHHFLFKK